MLLLPVLAFVFVSLLIVATAMALAPRTPVAVERRLGEIATRHQLYAPVGEPSRRMMVRRTLKKLGDVAPKSPSELTKLQCRLVSAGFRSPEALKVFSGVRIATAIVAFVLVAMPIFMPPNVLLALGAAALGYVIPPVVLGRMSKRRQHRIRLSLPDALDLLVVSVEAGLGLDQAMQRVGEELGFAHPEISLELRLINLELRAGKERSEALRNLAERTAVDDVASLVAILVQTDKFGTSVAQSLRVHSDVLRTKRKQRAEEAAAKTGAKMVFPLVFCIFPSVYVVTLGPAAIKIMELFQKLGGPMTVTAVLDALAPAGDVVPEGPLTLEATGLTADQVEQLLLKTLHGGEASGSLLSTRMCLAFGILEPLIERLRREMFIEVRTASGIGAAGYVYVITGFGRERAQQYLAVNGYIGPAPVPLSQYRALMAALAAARGYIDKERIRAGFSELIVGDEILERLGPAVNAGKAVFLFGAPGNGKSVLAEGMGRSLGGDFFVPHAIDIEGQVVTVFDPNSHQPIHTQPDESIMASTVGDRRWVRIRRPVITVGGELTLDMLDLRFNSVSKFYEAPLQLKSNGGVFLVDDFGRQRMRPEDLLNRWIVPLESRVDYLTLHTGRKLQIPFDVLVIFATNLDPHKLADEAFLRRIPYKIEVVDPTPDQFTRIFELNCARKHVPFDTDMLAYLHRVHYAPVNRPLRACHPRDLLEQVIALCRYRGQQPVLNHELLDSACRNYFVDRAAQASASAPGAPDNGGQRE